MAVPLRRGEAAFCRVPAAGAGVFSSPVLHPCVNTNSKKKHHTAMSLKLKAAKKSAPARKVVKKKDADAAWWRAAKKQLTDKGGAKKPAARAMKAEAAAAPAAGGLPANPPRDAIKPRVIAVIYAEAVSNGASAGQLQALAAGDETRNLQTHLNIDAVRRAALSLDYTAISTSYNGGKAVGQNEAKAAVTVANAINVVHARAKGQ
jgi:hypothetical protein